MAFEQKKLALFRILEILKNETDIDHTLTHKEIINKLSEYYGIELERKSVAANISALNECGYDNADVFYNMDLIDEAITDKKKVHYDYIKLNTKKEPIKDSEDTVSPYGYVLHNQRYYLLGFSDRWNGLIFHRLEWIKNLVIQKSDEYNEINDIAEFKNSVGYDNLIISRPYMYTDKLEQIKLKVINKYINDIYDWFGKDVLVKELNKNYSEVT